MRDGFLFASAFLASAVEMVEALTIVLASGLARGWRSSLAGLGAATVALAVIVGALGPALTLVPLSALRLVVGALLLAFGLQWLRKAILRASGYKPLHDEDAIFARELEGARTAAREQRAGLDWYGFTLSFKGVLLEGLGRRRRLARGGRHRGRDRHHRRDRVVVVPAACGRARARALALERSHEELRPKALARPHLRGRRCAKRTDARAERCVARVS